MKESALLQDAPRIERRNEGTREALRRRVHQHFDELRGLQVTLPQARRLFRIRTDVCRRVLRELVAQGLLIEAADGQFKRRVSDE